MENEIIPKSLTVRGTWKQQITGSIPNFDGIKFTVKTSDGESIKYEDWSSFENGGGDYLIGGNKKWSALNGEQTIEFFISNSPSVRTSKKVNVVKKPEFICDLIQSFPVYAGNKVSPYFKAIIRYSDGTIAEKFPPEITSDPLNIPVESLKPVVCTFTYSENGFSISKDKEVNVYPREYTVKVLSEDNVEAYIRDGSLKKDIFRYNFTGDSSLELEIETNSKNKGFKFNKWISNSNLISFGEEEKKTLLTIPKNSGLNIIIEAIWDKYFDEYGNRYHIEDGVLKSIDKIDSRLIIPEEVLSIEEGFFVNYNASSIILPSKLRRIEKETFRSCSIESIEIPESVEFIGPYAFEDCINLKSVKFNQKNPFIIGRASFRGCISLSSLDFLSLGRSFKDCIFGDENLDVWERCILKTIRIDKSCFSAVREIVKGNVNLLGNSGNGFRIAAYSKSRSGNICIHYPSGDVEVVDFSKNDYWRGSYRVWDFSNVGKENQSECSITTEGDIIVWIESLGLGHPQFNYATVSLPSCRYSFRSEDGGYVNDFIYPNVKFDTLSDKIFDDEVKSNLMREGLIKGGCLIDRMLPVYRSE